MQKTMFVIKRNKLILNQAIKTYPFFEKKSKFSTFFPIYLKYPFFIKSTNIPVENINLFWNCCFDKGRLKNFVSWFLNTYGEKKTIELLEQLKNLGFGYATKAGISLGVDDLKIPPQKFHLLGQAESQIFKGNEKYKKGQITEVERIQRLIDVWNQTSEFLKQEVIRYFERTDLFNPVYMMAFSGARGNISQVRQLVGMRGLMSDPQGNIIDFPIQSNFREGLTLTEYIISTYGARKGIVDTALRTATAGYLTRRLVDVAQHVMISQFDCGTTRGIFLFDMKEGIKTIYSFQNRLIGRVLGRDIIHPNNRSLCLGYRNQEISSSLADSIVKVTKKAFVRSPLTCETHQFVCQLCYGWSLASSKLVSVGEAVGVIAAQSIGEPGTQLTMRTFHTGGVFSGGLTNQIVAPYDGFIEYSGTIPGTCIRTPRGDIGFLTKAKGSFFIKEREFKKGKNQDIMFESKKGGKINDSNLDVVDQKFEFKSTIATLTSIFRSEFYTIPSYAILFVRNKEQVFKKQIVAQFSEAIQQITPKGYAEQTVYTQLEGQVSFFQIDLLERQNEKLLDDIVWTAMDWSKIWVLSGKIYYDALGLNTFVLKGDFITKNSIFQKIYWHNLNSCFLEISLNKQKNLKFKQNQRKSSINGIIPHLDLSFLNLKKEDYLNSLYFKNLNLPVKYKILSNKKDNENEKKRYNYSIMTKNFCLNSLDFNQNLKLKFSTKKIFLKQNLGFNIFSKSLTPKLKKNNYKQKKDFNKISLRILLKNKRLSPYIYPYRTKVCSFLFKKMNRINFLSYYIKFMISKRKKKKTLFKYMNKNIQNLKRNQKTIKKKINPFVFKSSIPNYFRKKRIKNKRFTINKNGFQKNQKIDLYFDSSSFQRFNEKSKISTLPSRDINFSYFKLSKKNMKSIFISSYFKDFKNQHQVQMKKSYSMKKSLLTLPVNNIFFQKLGYIFSIKRKTSSRFAMDQDPSDIILSFFPLKNLESMPLHSFNKNDPGKNVQKLSLGNTQNFSPFPKMAFRWFPFEYKTGSNGIFIWSKNFLSYNNSKIHEVDLKTKNLMNRPNADLYIKNYYFIQKKRWICVDGIFQKNNKKEITLFKNINNLMALKNIKHKQKINIFKEIKKDSFPVEKFDSLFEIEDFKESSISNKESSISNNRDQMLNNKIFVNNKYFFKKPNSMKFRYILPLNRKFQTFVTKKHLKKIFFFKKYLNNNMSLFDLISKFTKFSVYKQDFYFIPQENSRFDIWSEKNQNQNSYNLFSNVYLANRQGFKKCLTPKLSGFVRIYSSSQNKSLNSFVLNYNEKLKKSFKFLTRNEKDSKLLFLNHNLNKKLKLLKNKKRKQIFNKKNSFNNNKKTNPFMNDYYNIKKKASYKLDLSIRNKMIQNIFYKLFVKKNNKGNIPIKNEKQIKNSFYKFNDSYSLLSSKKIKEKTLIAQLKNQSLFFSCFPFKKKGSKNQRFNLKSNILTNNKKQNQRNKRLFLERAQVERITKPGWVYCLINTDFLLVHSSPSQTYKTKTNTNTILSLKNDNFLYLKKMHQNFTNPGKKIIHDICFEQNKIFIENINFLNQPLKNEAFLNKQKQIKGGHIYTNKNCRFFDGHLSSKIFKQKNLPFLESEIEGQNHFLTHKKSDKKNQKYNFLKNIGLLFRPVYHKILPNPQLFKTHISCNKKDFYHHFSILLYKDFHSKFLNQQTCDKKMLSKYPSLDFQIREVSPFNLAFDNKYSKKDFGKKLQTIKTNQTKPLDLQMVLKEKSKNQRKTKFYQKIKNKHYYKIPIKNHRFNLMGNTSTSSNVFKNLREKQLNFNIQPKKLNSYFFENLFYSAYKCHSFSLDFKTTQSLGFDFGFNIPTFYLKYSDLNLLNIHQRIINQKNGFFSFQKKLNFSQVFLKLIQKNNIRKQFFLTSNQIRKNTFFSKNIIYNKIVSSKILYKDSDMFFSFFYLCPFQRLEWAFAKKEAYLANYISSMNKFGEESSSKMFPNPYNAHSNQIKLKQVNPSSNKRFKSLSKTSILKNNKGFKITNKKVYNMTSFSFSFPFFENSFLLYKANNKVIANKVYASTNLFCPFEGEILTTNYNKWWQDFSEIELKHKKFDIKYNVFLTKKDIFSISMQLNPFQAFIPNNGTKYPSIFSFLSLRNKGLFINPKQKIQIELLDTFQLPPDIWKVKEHNERFDISNFVMKYRNKLYKLKGLSIGKYLGKKDEFNLGLGNFLLKGDNIFFTKKIDQTGQIIHLSPKKITLRYAQPFLLSPKTILHVQQGDFIYRNAPILTLPFDTLTTGDIVQGIPKVEQYLEARTTQNGRFFLYSLPVLQKAIFERYRSKLPLEQAVAQSFLKIQQIIVDGVQRVYRSQGVSIAEKHLEVIVKQMTSKVQIIHGGQTGFFPGELVDLDIVENVNKFLMVKIRYEPIVLGITRASLEVESFLSAASFQQTTKILAKASLSKKKDYLKGLKENLLVGNLIPAGTGFMNSYL